MIRFVAVLLSVTTLAGLAYYFREEIIVAYLLFKMIVLSKL